MIAAKTPYLYIGHRQAALWCRKCGREGTLKGGFCLACYARERRNRVYFAGLRPRVLDRDGNTCQVCGRRGGGKRLPVHHRRSGVSKERLLITLCPGCHAIVHRTRFCGRMPVRALQSSGGSSIPVPRSSSRSHLTGESARSRVKVVIAGRLWLDDLGCEVDSIQQREGSWVILDLVGKGRPLGETE